MTYLVKRLVQRIKNEFNIDVEPKLYRTRAGYRQKANGTWLWYMNAEVLNND